MSNFSVVNHKKDIRKRLKEEKINLHKSVKLTEDARAAKLRAKKHNTLMEGTEFTATGKVIEVDLREYDEDRGKHVRFADQGPSKNYTGKKFENSF